MLLIASKYRIIKYVHILKRVLPAGKMLGGMRPCLVRFDSGDLAGEMQMETQGSPGEACRESRDQAGGRTDEPA